jgi:hypothetical protein
MEIQPKLKPRAPTQAAPVARHGAVKNEKGVGPSFGGCTPTSPAIQGGCAFAADDAE